MTDTQHTPGPWQVGARYGNNKIEIADASYDKLICTVWTHQFQGSMFEPDRQFQPLPYGAANARLIAASPEMLDALKELVGAVEKFIHPQPDKPHSAWAKLVRARAAIAKATGQ